MPDRFVSTDERKSYEVFRQWRGQYWMDLLGAYLGAPVKEVYSRRGGDELDAQRIDSRAAAEDALARP